MDENPRYSCVVINICKEGGEGREGGEGGRAYSFVACLSHLTIDNALQPLGNGAPFLLLIETPPTFGR